eukprot:CAMPEP_0117019958 /NCGR_PEP_ID=MMETSP0472-20121206/15234_1 /TAXON_ID=693140 ORGANISM="Tiarina fusus, Strain LIS" /NCGR_SAMPLE_ID=MMETSP0472 /ASSEMBLY_ACC=CAM_ASM_000603 /LENGTH=268 /DNA_ID=CAMNT_0004725039 /DNA_START=71 /DNA_END=874 /DNA_ORIENTATION=-
MLEQGTSLLPLDVWLVLLDYLELRDLPSLLVTSRGIKDAVDQEVVYEHRSRSTYPAATIDVSKYNNSYKDLIRGGNGENGIYVRHFPHMYSKWRNNAPHRFYVGSLRSLVWDRKIHRVLATIEAFGHGDLRPADTSLVSRVSSMDRIEVPLDPIGVHAWTYEPEPQRPGQPVSLGFLGQRRQHDLCQLTFREEDFSQESNLFIFTYSGTMNMSLRRGIRSDDYESVVFLEEEETSGRLSDMFNLQKKYCEFVPRDANNIMEPSNVLDW